MFYLVHPENPANPVELDVIARVLPTKCQGALEGVAALRFIAGKKDVGAALDADRPTKSVCGHSLQQLIEGQMAVHRQTMFFAIKVGQMDVRDMALDLFINLQ